jgi:hypothetical protein
MLGPGLIHFIYTYFAPKRGNPLSGKLSSVMYMLCSSKIIIKHKESENYIYIVICSNTADLIKRVLFTCST